MRCKVGHPETLHRMNEWGGEGREGGGQRTKEGNKESGENKGLRKEGGNDERERKRERHSNPLSSQTIELASW